ncbi:molybdopterin-binding protein [Rhodobacteraceae bacterium XHP0102]|nr:molybdopterin-binding protein [Rhodobacteraceae bacterium XHP0102]
MKFGPVPIAQAQGAILAHSVPVAGGLLKKGTWLDAEDVAALRAAGVTEVTVAALDANDVDENSAALRLAEALIGAEAGLSVDAPFTGRVNLRSTGAGVLRVDAARIAAVNAIDPRITIATLPPWQRVTKGMMVATIKIIPYAVPEAELAQAIAASAGADAQSGLGAALARIAPKIKTAILILTSHAGDRAAKREAKSIAAVAGRLSALEVALRETRICAHEAGGLSQHIIRAQAEADLILILTASATSDEADVMPAALCAAGGEITRFGMPVDPGNLLVLGALGATPVIGLPGCARSPALNGADWVLERVICGHPPSAEEIGAMGVGGLLKEIPTRPQPREGRKR